MSANLIVKIIEIYPSPNRPQYLKSKGIELSTSDSELINVIKRSVLSKTFDEMPGYEANSEAIDFIVASELAS
jgi:hypothetical protein